MYELGQYLVNEPAQNDVSDTCHPLLACPARFERATWALVGYCLYQSKDHNLFVSLLNMCSNCLHTFWQPNRYLK